MEFTALSKEERLETICEGIIANLPSQKASLEAGRTNEKFVALAGWGNYRSFGLKSFFVDKDINKTKQYFSYCGELDILVTNKYDEKILDHGIDHLTYAILSDNRDLIMRYADLTHSLYEQSIHGGNSAPMYILQCLIKDDWDGFNRTMPIMKNKTVPKLNMELDYNYYEALAEKNKSKIESILAEFVMPKQHKKRNQHALVNELVSHPALGYAKLAWMKGIEVEVNSLLVPKELLPIAPLPAYTDEYNFLKKEGLL
jgi:hypothetical protein